MRHCRLCSMDKPASEFYQSQGTAWCKECFRGYMLEQRATWKQPTTVSATKRCTKCRHDKQRAEFGANRFGDGRHPQCKACLAAKARLIRAAKPDISRRRKYGMAIGEYDRLYRAQCQLCAICRRQRRLVVDHDHATGRVRGLLCKPCNSAIGFFEDSVGALTAAAIYVCHGTNFKDEAERDTFGA